MAKFSTNSKSDVIFHIGIIFASFLVLFLTFFFVYLPWSTNHGQAITVPDLKDMSIEQMKTALDDRNLDYEVQDCTFVANVKPLTVVSQYPKAGSSVKSGRKIYLTITSETAPMVKMPDILGRSVSSAKNQLLSSGLQSGEVKYIPRIEENTVLELELNGNKIKPGDPLPKGSKITLLVGDGLADQMTETPTLIGMPLDEAEILVAGQDLKIGNVIYEGKKDGVVDGTITQQKPVANGNKMRIGGVIDLWVAGDAPN
jgi:eukaryotic-like serine/threonine-protein kinase